MLLKFDTKQIAEVGIFACYVRILKEAYTYIVEHTVYDGLSYMLLQEGLMVPLVCLS